MRWNTSCHIVLIIKSPRWDGLTNELFKKYVIKVKGPFTILFQKVWTSGQMLHILGRFGLIKLFAEGASPYSFVLLNGGLSH